MNDGGPRPATPARRAHALLDLLAESGDSRLSYRVGAERITAELSYYSRGLIDDQALDTVVDDVLNEYREREHLTRQAAESVEQGG